MDKLFSVLANVAEGVISKLAISPSSKKGNATVIEKNFSNNIDQQIKELERQIKDL